MQEEIRIIKRSAKRNTNVQSVHESNKTDQQREREMAKTVKSWIAEWEARNRALKTAAASLIHSLKGNTPSPALQFSFNQ
jgi:hypothetical protein